MDVRCDRCGTEYEFDDALVSERGTSVKCTNCGHQFKVFRPRAQVSSPEHWLVRTADGRELMFHALRELQKAILSKQVSRADSLGRGEGSASRSLSAIPELAPFFDDADRGVRPVTASQPSPRPRVATPAGLGQPPLASALRHQSSPALGHPVPSRPPAALATLHGVAPAPNPPASFYEKPTMPGRSLMEAMVELEAPTPLQAEPAPPQSEPEPPTARRMPAAAGAVAMTSVEPSPFEDARTSSPGDVSPHSGAGDFFDEPTSLGRSGRAGALRWVVAAVLAGTLAVLGGTVGRRWLAEAGRGGAAPVDPAAGRVKDLISDGDRALAEGDLESAQEHLIKASALVESDHRVLVGLARLSAMHADVPWLRLRLLPADAVDARKVAQTQLDQASLRAKKAADRAAEGSPDDPVVARVKIDALRLQDDRSVARALAPRLAASAMQPETAYVLAALDLGERSPPWASIIERLQLAATAETSPGRARAALVYALSRSGDAAAARAEFDRMVASARPYPLLPELRALLSEPASGPPDAGARDASPAAAAAQKPAVDIASLPAAGVAGNVAAAPRGDVAPSREPAAREPAPSGNDSEFSETELQRRLLGDKQGHTVVPVPQGSSAPAPKKPARPDVDTSDLPGVTPP